ncbi:IS3 family transposase, partial [Actinomadura vinacea]|uniref:IS3 family transposase n=1 Tax=Actinomadura vinacea TaxID=115336 RepID=UPI0031E20EF4
SRPASARAVRDERLKTEITRIHQDNYQVYGARKVWRQLQREGHQAARCTVERLMRGLGLTGARRGRKVRTTVRDDRHERAADLLRRDFTATAPNRRWVADFTHVTTWAGVVYVAFVVDIFSRAIVGWAAATTKRTRLVLDALDMALWRRDRAGRPVGPGLVHHSHTLGLEQRDLLALGERQEPSRQRAQLDRGHAATLAEPPGSDRDRHAARDRRVLGGHPLGDPFPERPLHIPPDRRPPRRTHRRTPRHRRRPTLRPSHAHLHNQGVATTG